MKFTLAQGRLLAAGTGRTTARRAVDALVALGVVEITAGSRAPDGRPCWAYVLTEYGRMLRADMRDEFRFGTGRGQRRKRG